MDDEYTHPLLAQVPLTVSPFVSLPTATTLPYTYKSLPTSLPRSSTPTQQTATTEAPSNQKSKFVVSSSGHAAHPDDILASCHALQAHLNKVRDDAIANLDKWEGGIKERELAEKRRLAPGWLDSDDKMLQPQRALSVSASAQSASTPPPTTQQQQQQQQELRDNQTSGPVTTDPGAELDRAFGGIALRSGNS